MRRQSILSIGVEAQFWGNELENFNAVERPAVGSGDMRQLLLALRKRDVETAFTLCAAVKQKLQAKRRLPRARLSFEQMDAASGKAAGQDVVQRWQAGRHWAAIV